MKKQSNISFPKLSKDSLTDFTKEVKETLASGFQLPGKKAFTAADLWNIQRNSRHTVQRRLVC